MPIRLCLGRLGRELRSDPRGDCRDLSSNIHRHEPPDVAVGWLPSQVRCAAPRVEDEGRQSQLHHATHACNRIDMPTEQRDVVQLITLRSNDQFNTAVYGYDDRFRGVHGTRMMVLMHRNDMARFELDDRDIVSLSTAVDDGRLRTISAPARRR